MSEALDLVEARPPCQAFSSLSMRRRIRAPRLQLWSISRAEANELTGGRRADFERELRISALGSLICATTATPLWRRICLIEEMREIRARSADQCVAMELAILESAR